MGNRNKPGPRRNSRPVNPGQQELAIMRRLMEEAIAMRVRVEDQARQVQARNGELQLLVAGLLLQQGGDVTLSDDLLGEMGNFAGWETERDKDAGTLRLYMIPYEFEGEEE